MSNKLEKLDQVLMLTRQYFAMEYHAGTRYMIERYIFRNTGENVDPILISAALKILKDNGAILMDHRVWFFIADR
jgi:hypothetical protein